jgi:hypothetical protein
MLTPDCTWFLLALQFSGFYSPYSLVKLSIDLEVILGIIHQVIIGNLAIIGLMPMPTQTRITGILSVHYGRLGPL